MIASLYTNPAFVGLVLALPSAILGYLGYRRAQRADEVAMQAGIATVEAGSIGQAIDGLIKLNAALQTDNAEFREDRIALEQCRLALAALGRTTSWQNPPTERTPPDA